MNLPYRPPYTPPFTRFATGPCRISAMLGLAVLATTASAQMTYEATGLSAGPSIPLEIRFSAVDTNQPAAMTQDLNIMSLVLERHLDRTVGPRGRPIRMGIPLLLPGATPRVQGTYLEGFGVLFGLQVDIPLLPPPTESASTSQPGMPGSEWEAARRVLAGASTGSSGLSWPAAGNPPPVQYDSSRVKSLRRDLMMTLKEAANIRGLAPKEWVALVVVGPGGGGKARVTGGIPSPYPSSSRGDAYGEVSGPAGGGAFASGGFGGGGGYGGGGGLYGAASGASPGADPHVPSAGGAITSFHVSFGDVAGSPRDAERSVLTLRARKADIDAFSAGTLEGDGFAQRMESNLYAAPTADR